MKTTKIFLTLASVFALNQGVFASDIESMVPSENLNDIFKESAEKNKKVKDIPGILEAFQAKHTPKETEELCKEIKDPRFYAAAEKAGVGTIKNRAMVTWCEGVTYERLKYGAIKQKEKTPEKAPETVKLKPVDFGEKGKSVEGEQHKLEEVKKVISENLVSLREDKSLTPAQQKRVEELTVQVKEAEKELAKAKENYDNLSVAITILRGDLKNFSFQYFKPQAHENSTAEVYLEALNTALPKEHPHILDSGSRGQLTQADAVLKQANENLAEARKDLEIINREMIQLTGK